jgi:hypothetical protein
MDSSKQNRQLAVVERLGAFAWKWLGGRDSANSFGNCSRLFAVLCQVIRILPHTSSDGFPAVASVYVLLPILPER